MLCTAYLNVLVDQARNPDALSSVIEGIAERFISDERSVINLIARVGKNRRLLGLVGTAVGFPIKGPTYQGNLLAQLDWHAAWRLVVDCARADPTWIRGAEITIVASAVLLAEGRRDVEWQFGIDGLVRLRKKRGALAVRATFRAPAVDRTAIRNLLVGLEQLAGFPMRHASLSFAGEAPQSGSVEAVAAGALERLGRSLTAAVAEQLRPLRLRWADFPLMQPSGDAESQRMERMLSGTPSPKVNFDMVARAFAGHRYPSSLFERHPDGIDIVIPTGRQAETVVRILTAPFRVGKQFAVECAVRVTAGPMAGRMLAPSDLQGYRLGTFFDNFENFAWAYDSADGAARALEEAGHLLDLVLPRLIDQTCWLFEESKGPAPEAGVHHEMLTFHEAVAIGARALGRFRHNETRVVGVSVRGPGVVARSGRLERAQSWLVRFADPQNGGHVDVCVPANGWLGFAIGYGRYVRDLAGVRQLLRSPPAVAELIMLGAPELDPIGYTERLLSGMVDLADSPEVMECAEAHGGKDFQKHHPGARVTLQFERDSDPDGRWIVRYAATGARDRDVLLISTSIGKPVKVAGHSPTASVNH